MNIVSLTWARNEEDVLESFIRHNSSIVDRMIIALHRCTDRSKEIVEQCMRDGCNIELRESDALHHAQGETLTELLQETDADWVLPLDADEFLVGEDARSTIESLPSDVVHLLPWKTYVPTPGDDATQNDPLLRITHRRVKEPAQYYKVLIPRQFLKGSLVHVGSHKVIDAATGLERPSSPQAELWLAHFPVRSEQQLRRKIIEGWESHTRNPDYQTGQGIHWQHLYSRCKDLAPIGPNELQIIAVNYAAPDGISVELIEDPVPHAVQSLL